MENTSRRTDGIDLAFDTARLQARALCDADERLFCTLFCDPKVMLFIGTPLTAAHAAQRFRAVINDHGRAGVILTISERMTDRPVGICSIHKLDQIRRVAEAGILLLPEHQARGYSKEAFPTLVTTAFVRLRIDEIRIRIPEAHSISLHNSVSYGFKRRIDLEAAEDGPGLQIWSVDRSTWPIPPTIADQGEENAGTHRLP